MKVTLKVFFVILFLSLIVIRPTSSYAYWHHGYVGVAIGVPGPYYYGYPYGYPYYDPYYYPGYAVVASSSYQPTVINGVTYYLNNGVYYIYTQNGYQAVPAPTGSAVSMAAPSVPVEQVASSAGAEVTATAASDDSITINIPNYKGGYTAVILKRSGSGFVGPQGEFYAEFPKVSQLQTMYGK